jgi:AcrR family transcriptional regulator
MTTRTENHEEMRERILDTADKLFYGKGIRAIGVDTVAEMADISKRTLYNYFPSKDALIVAYLSRRLAPPTFSDRPPIEQILGNFDRLERSFAERGFRGCPFVNAVAELSDPAHTANRIAVEFKDQRRDWFRELLARLGVKDPVGLAMQLQLLADGAIVHAVMRRDPSMARVARDAASVLLRAAGVEIPPGA